MNFSLYTYTRARTWACLLCLGFALGFRALAAQPEPRDGDAQDALAEISVLPGGPVAGEPIDDIKLGRFLEAEGRRMLARGATITNWSGQLGDTTARLKLPRPSNRARKPAEIARRMEASVAVVGTFYLCDKCSKLHLSMASGSFLSETGAFATCRHVLAGFEKNGRGIVVLTRDGKMYGVKSILSSDRANDLLVLQVDGKNFSPLPLAAKAPEPGSPIFVVSHPEQHFFMFTTGVVGRQSVRRNRYGTASFLTITADFAKGSSGAPVCDETGAIVGIVNNTESIYYSIEKEQQKNLQMVLKNCSLSTTLSQMLSGKAPADRLPKEPAESAPVRLARELSEQIQARDWPKAEASLAELEKAATPTDTSGFDFVRFTIALGKDDLAAAARFAGKLSDAHPGDSQMQNQLAWELAKRKDIAGPALETAAKIARQAVDETQGKNGAILDTLARVLFVQGKKEQAIEFQKKAVQQTEDAALRSDL